MSLLVLNYSSFSASTIRIWRAQIFSQLVGPIICTIMVYKIKLLYRFLDLFFEGNVNSVYRSRKLASHIGTSVIKQCACAY
jgi:hypothetical protein